MSRVLIAHGAQYLRRERINGVVPRPPRRTTNRKAGTFRGLRARARRDMGFWVGLRGAYFVSRTTPGVCTRWLWWWGYLSPLPSGWGEDEPLLRFVTSVDKIGFLVVLVGYSQIFHLLHQKIVLGGPKILERVASAFAYLSRNPTCPRQKMNRSRKICPHEYGVGMGGVIL